MPAASSNKSLAAGVAWHAAWPMPTAWAPWPGNRNAVRAMLFLVHHRRGSRRQLLDDLFVQPGRCILGRNRQGVFDRPLAGAAVADDANAVDPQKRRPAIGAVVVLVNQGRQHR